MSNPPDLVSVAETSVILRRSVRTVHRLIYAGDLKPAIKVPGQTGAYLLERADVEAYQRAHAEPTAVAS